MKIARIESFILGTGSGKDLLFCRVETDDGTYGWGEAYVTAGKVALISGRLGLAQDTAQLVLFLASDESACINGAEIGIVGGYIAAGLSHLRNRARPANR